MIKADKLKEVSSSNIHKACYDEDKKCLYLVFVSQKNQDVAYEYADVPVETYNEMISAPSIGSYFYHNIRDLYKFNIVDIEK